MLNEYNAKPAQGFSIIEVLITLVILGVGLSGVATLQKVNIDGTVYAKQSSTAAQLAQAKIATLSTALNTIDGAGSEPVIDAGTGVTFTRIWTADEGPDGTTRASVTVKWPDNATGITVSSVGKNYTPDQAYRTLKVVPVAPTNKVAKAYTAESTSSCGRNTVTHCDDKKREDDDGDSVNEYYNKSDYSTWNSWSMTSGWGSSSWY